MDNYVQNNEQSLPIRAKARIFRDPESYDTISDALLDTIYDIRTPEESTEQIFQDMRKSR